MAYLDKNGLTRLWSKIKTLINNLTTDMMDHWLVLAKTTWIATSSVNGTQLTNKITLQPGVYFVLWKVPYASSGTPFTQLVVGNTAQDEGIAMGGPYTMGSQFIVVQSATTIYVKSVTTITYSYLERGWLAAIRIGSA